MYLSYTYNPFNDTRPRKSISKSPLPSKKDEKKVNLSNLNLSAKNIIDGWSDMRKKGDISEFLNRTEKIESTALVVFNKMQKERKS